MQFLKTAFWAILAVLIALFSYANWKPAEINLWGDLQIVTPLPIVVVISFLAGVLPMWLLHKATHWSMRRKLDSAERALASVKPGYPPPPPSSDVFSNPDTP
jgi:uncharacterized integral membrane protein